MLDTITVFTNSSYPKAWLGQPSHQHGSEACSGVAGDGSGKVKSSFFLLENTTPGDAHRSPRSMNRLVGPFGALPRPSAAVPSSQPDVKGIFVLEGARTAWFTPGGRGAGAVPGPGRDRGRRGGSGGPGGGEKEPGVPESRRRSP